MSESVTEKFFKRLLQDERDGVLSKTISEKIAELYVTYQCERSDKNNGTTSGCETRGECRVDMSGKSKLQKRPEDALRVHSVDFQKEANEKNDFIRCYFLGKVIYELSTHDR